MLKTLTVRLALAAAVTLSGSVAMAAVIDTGDANNGMTGIYSTSFAGALPACTGGSPSYCAFFGGLPSAGQVAVIGLSPNPTGVQALVPGGIGPTGIPVAPAPGAGSFLNLTSNGTSSSLTGGTITFGDTTITIPSQGVTATVNDPGMVFDSALQNVLNVGQTAEFLVNLSPAVAVDFSRFSQVTTSCTGPGAPGGVCGLITGDVLNLDMVRYRLFVQWDPTFTSFTSTFIGQTGNNSMVFANLNSIPVPAAVWLMGSALGLLGFARRKKAVA